MKERKYFTGLTKNSFLLTFASFFSDVSTEMLYPVIPIFLNQVLMAPVEIVGLIEGVAEGTQNIIQGVSGRISDRIGRKKPVAVVGYILAAISKPFIGLSTIWQQVLVGRFSDRLGSGIRSAPRDALIASSVEDKFRGKAFGLEGFGDNLGAVVGPLIAAFLIFTLKINLRSVFYLAFIPGLVALLMILLVKETKKIAGGIIFKANLKSFPKVFWIYLFVIAIFGIGNSSNAFLILRAKAIGIPTETTILIYALFNLVASLVSYPTGSLSDKFGRKKLMIAAFLIFIICYLGFAFSLNLWLIAFLFILYGAYQGTFRAVGKSLATDFIPKDQRATGIGLYSTVIGLTSLLASITAGILWDKLSPTSVFLYGAFFSTLAVILMQIFIPAKKYVLE